MEKSSQKQKKRGQDIPVKHRIEGSDLVHAHRRHLKYCRHMVHRTDARPSIILPLSEIQKRNNGGLLILRRVFGNDRLGTLHVLCIELERNL